MESNIDTLTLLAEITIAFVAFATITASIKMTLGVDLSAYQRLVIHYFTESAMISISIIILTLVLLNFFPDRVELASIISCIYAFVACSAYMLWYMRRRIAIKAPTPIASMLVIIGYFAMIVLLGITISGLIWKPSIEIVCAVASYNLLGAAVIFSAFLGGFIDSNKDETP
ncbi:MAG: hypothetical protein DRR42_12970 [Gammaproteobacteria bacterium]|nr:MAG: hypothetical protein DRR42_12970 [Gammaproteobacteria bacterium]